GMDSFGTEFRYRDPKTGKLDGELMSIDFAKNAESLGCKAYTVRNEDELRKAVGDAKRQRVSTLIDIKVLPKTMTHDYESWWRVGVAQVANEESIMKVSESSKVELDKARRY